MRVFSRLLPARNRCVYSPLSPLYREYERTSTDCCNSLPADVLSEFKLFCAHINRRSGKGEPSANEANYLIAMLYFTPKTVPTVRHAELLQLVHWFHGSIKQISNRNKMVLAQLEDMLTEQVNATNQTTADSMDH